jgi:ABC-type antimicrobial peptide transport system permease subunit
MKISDLFIMGLRNLSRRKARTILTVLGVIIGSLSIIIMRSIGYGLQDNFETTIMQQGGLNEVHVRAQANIFDDDMQWLGSKEQKLDNNLVNQIKAIKHVRAVTPVIEKYARLYSGKYVTGINITAMDISAFQDFDFPELEYGSFPTGEDNTPLVLGAGAIYGFYDPTSFGRSNNVEVDIQKKKLTLKFDEFQVEDGKKEFSMTVKNIAKLQQTDGQYDWSAYMDINYLKTLYRKYSNTLKAQDRKKAIRSVEEYSEIRLVVDNIRNVTTVQDEIEKLGYSSESIGQFLESLQEGAETLQMVLGALGLVAMGASAISIANTMVMSIYERTKEIGVMKVLGCTIGDIRKLFLFEAGTIGLFGGIIGIILGYIGSWGINKFGGPLFQKLMSTSYMYDMSNAKFSIIPLYLPFAALLISISVGLVSGYFPARRATKISAIEAMKTEN